MKKSNTQTGAVIVTISITLLVMVLAVAVAVDIGWLVFVRQQAQAAVDASALAGASATPNCGNEGAEANVGPLIEAFNMTNPGMMNPVINGDPNISLGDMGYVSYDFTEPNPVPVPTVLSNSVNIPKPRLRK